MREFPSSVRESAATIFLGWGRVTKALAQIIEGDALIFDEDSAHGERAADPHLKMGYLRHGVSDVDWFQTEPGDFDSLEWKKWTAHAPEIFISPGIDCRRPFFKKVEAFEKRELDLFTSRFKGKIIAITGTDGKSTATFQGGELLKRACPERTIFVGGNIGHAMSLALLEKPQADIAVIEVSSYQCERLQRAHVDSAIILNLDQDHLDRYATVQDYHRAKWQLLRRAETLFYPSDCKPLIEDLPASSANYTNHEKIETILRSVMKVLSEKWNFPLNERIFENLPTLPHRLESFRGLHGIVCINDSKATTVHAALYGLRSAQARFPHVYWLMGGREKGDDFSRIQPQLRETDHVLIFGEAAPSIRKQIGAFSHVTIYPSLGKALEGLKMSLRQEEGTGQILCCGRTHQKVTDLCILLSPACSSFDEFSHFEERGDFFKREITSKF